MNILNSKSKNKRVEFGAPSNGKPNNTYVVSKLKCILDDLDDLANKLN
jgi:hypothetical protein